MKKLLLALLALAPVALAQTFYEKTTINPRNSYYQVFDVMAYGAKCNDTGDDVTAINLAFAAARTALATQQIVKVIFPPQKECLVHGPINMTGFNSTGHQLIVEGNGVSILANSTYVGPIIDMLGTAHATVRDLWLVAYLGTQTYGVQGGRYTSASAGENLFINVTATGKFTKGACYFNASETNTYINMQCANSTTSGAIFGLILDGANHWNVTSSFVTVTAVVDTVTSMANNYFISPKLFAYSASGAPLWLEGSGQTTFTNCYAQNTAVGGVGAFLYSTADVDPYESNRLMYLDCHFEGSTQTSLAYDFWITGPGSGANFSATPIIRSLDYKDLDSWASTSVFAIDAAANITTATLTNLKLDVPRARNTITVFDTPANYSVTGEAYLNDSTMWNGLATWYVKVNSAGTVTDKVNSLAITGTKTGLTFGATGVHAGLNVASATLTDTVSGAGTIATMAASHLGTPTLTSTNALTLTQAETLLIDAAPVASTNVTITNPYAIRVLSGQSRFDGTFVSNSTAQLLTGPITINNSGSTATSIGTGTYSGILTLANSSATLTMSAGTVNGTGWALLPAITAATVTSTGLMTAGSTTTAGQMTSTLATGTAPLVIASTTNVANLNASTLSGATFAAPGAIGGTTPSTGAFTSTTATTSASVAGYKLGYPILQGAIPFVLPPSAFHAANGVVVLGQTPGSSATITFGATSGSTTATFSAGTNLTGTSADVGRVITILDTTYKYFTVTTGTSTTVCTGTLSATLSGTVFANNVVWLSGTFATTNTAGGDGVLKSSPLPRVIGNSFSYWPANSVTASNTAGWYWTVWASTTEGVVNTDTYTTGTPTVVASPVAYAVAGNGAVAQTTATYFTGPQLSLAGNSMGINGGLEWLWVSSANNTAGNKVSAPMFATVKVGQANVTGSGILAVGGFASVANRGVTNAQVSNVGNGATSSLTTSTTLPLVQAIDTTAAQVSGFAINLNSAATDVNVLESYSLKLFPAP